MKLTKAQIEELEIQNILVGTRSEWLDAIQDIVGCTRAKARQIDADLINGGGEIKTETDKKANEHEVFAKLTAINKQLVELNDKHQKIRLQAQKDWGMNYERFCNWFLFRQ